MGSESDVVPSTTNAAVTPMANAVAPADGSLLVGEAREAVVVRQLRGCIKFVVFAGLAVIVLGYMPTEVIDSDYRPHIERAGSDELTFCTLAMLAAARWVYCRPGWLRMLAWMVWVATWQVVLVAIWIPRSNVSMGSEQLMIGFLLGVINFVVGMVMPLVRVTDKHAPPPPKLPSARIAR